MWGNTETQTWVSEGRIQPPRPLRLRGLGTGWAQVNGRKDVEWHKRIKLNVWYIDHCTFLLDLKILFMTVFKVLTNADNENKGKTVQEQKTGEQE